MKKGLKFLNVIAIIGCLVLSNVTAFAAEKDFYEVPNNTIDVYSNKAEETNMLSNPTLAACTLGIGIASNGVSISFVTHASQVADEIGVKNVVLQEKTWYGWKDIPVSNYYTNNSEMYVGEVIYTNAEAGKTYRVHCTHYAKFGSTELTLYSESNNLVYN